MDLLAPDSPIDTIVNCINLEGNSFKELYPKKKVEPSRLSCITFNARSIRGHFRHINAFLRSLDYDFTFIIITEIWLSKNIDHGFLLEGYNSTELYRDTRGGGIKLFIKKGIGFSIVSQCTQIFPSHECLTVRTSIPNYEDLLLCCVYRPPDRSVDRFLQWLQLNLEEFVNSSCIIAGDFNLNLNNLNKSKIREYNNLMSLHGFVNFIDKPTCLNPQTGTPYSLLDHIWSNRLLDSDSFVFDERITDHLPCALISTVSTKKSVDKVKVIFRDFSRINIAKFVANSDSLFNGFKLSNSDVNLATNELLTKINAISNTYFPIKSKHISLRRFSMPWLTPSLCKCINIKNLCLRALRFGDLRYGMFKMYSKLLDLLLRVAEINFYKKKFTQRKNNSKGTWKLINSFLGRNQSSLSESFLVQGKCLSDPQKIADEFNTFFIKIPYKIQENLPASIDSPLEGIPFLPFTFYITPITPDETVSVISKLKAGDNINDIPVKMLKLAPAIFAIQFANLFNLYVQYATYPDALKIAKIQPIFKSGKHNLIENHRPISILPLVDKLFEKLLFARIYSFVSKFNLLASHQYGFRKHVSTSHATLKLLDDVLPAFSQNSYAASIFIDFRKAFDTVNHEILLNKLERIGFRGISNDLIKSFLSNRMQYVKYDTALSKQSHIGIGVPQGSCLGPLLYNLYVNDIHSNFLNCHLVMYADDTVFTACDNNSAALEQFMNDTLKQIFQWCLKNKLVINTDKTEWMLFSNKKLLHPLELKINNSILDQTDSFKYLGFTMDSRCTFRHHIEIVNAKLSKIAGLAYRIGKYLTIDVAVTIYYAFAYSILNYGIAIWGGTLLLSNISQLQKTQNKIVKNLFKHHFLELNILEIYKRLRLLNVIELYKLNLAVTMYRALKLNQLPFIVNGITGLLSSHGYPTRSRNLVRVPFPRVNAIRYNFLFQGITTWNSLPNDLKESKSLVLFSRKCKHHLLNQSL